MNCPVCNVALTMTDRQGVEIDYCPRCRGVWLDRGELDKIIERSETAYSAGARNLGGRERPADQYGEHNRQNEERDRFPEHGSFYPPTQHHQQPHKKHKKRESFLGELFDFD